MTDPPARLVACLAMANVSVMSDATLAVAFWTAATVAVLLRWVWTAWSARLDRNDAEAES